MGYSKEHVERTRQRILDCAGRQFRRFGYSGVGIDKIMNEAGLTRGGFYAHFKSKSQLFKAMVAERFDFTNQLERLGSEAPPGIANRALFAISHYLGTDSRDHIARACTMASSAIDVSRADKETQSAFENRINELVSKMRDLFDADGSAVSKADALAILSSSVGSLILARACTDAVAQEILQASLNSTKQLLKQNAPE